MGDRPRRPRKGLAVARNAEDTGRVVVTFGIDGPPEKAGLRHLPRLTREALRIAWAAGRFDVMVTAALQVVGGFGIAALLLLGQAALDALLRAVQEGASLRSLLPWALAMAAVAGIQAFAGAVQRERQQILGELVGRY